MSPPEPLRIPPADKGKAETFFRTGTDAAQKDNFEYAIQMLKDACRLHPDQLAYRQALRGVERKKFQNDPGKVGMLVGARNQPLRMRARSAVKKGNYTQALEACED